MRVRNVRRTFGRRHADEKLSAGIAVAATMRSVLCVPEPVVVLSRHANGEDDVAMNDADQSPFDPLPSKATPPKSQARRDLQTQIDELKAAIAAVGIELELPAGPVTGADEGEVALDADDVAGKSGRRQGWWLPTPDLTQPSSRIRLLGRAGASRQAGSPVGLSGARGGNS